MGAKAALFCGDSVLVYLRDDFAGLPWAAMWDLPGGGREGCESGEDCVLREIAEEFGLVLKPERLVFRLELPSMTDPARMSWLFAGRVTSEEISAIRFGDEGQHWELMPVEIFVTHPRGIPEMQRRVTLAQAAVRPA